jgi:antigen flippase
VPVALCGTALRTLIAIPIVYVFRENGVVPSLVALAAATAVTSWWFSKSAHLESRGLTASVVWHEAAALLKLGFAFMSSGLMTMGVAYAVRVAVLRNVGLEGAGLYQAAWTFGGLYVGFILQAMGADFYPRLTASAHNNAACNRLVNEQTRIGLLLAGPGVIATLTCAPLVLAMFYSSRFGAASGVLRWICLGVTLQVITWPMP